MNFLVQIDIIRVKFFFFGWGFLIFEFVGIFNFLLRIVVLLPRNDIDICKVD